MTYADYKENCIWLGMNEQSYNPTHVGKNNQISAVPKRCFGHRYVSNWNFRGNDEFRQLDVMDTVKRRAFFADPNGNPVLALNKLMTVGTFKNGKEVPLGVVSDRYKTITDIDLMDIVYQVIHDTNLEVGGSYISENGQTSVVVFFKNPEYRFDQGLGTGREDNALIGMVITNDHRGKASCKIMTFGVREICWNFQLWGDIIGKQTIRHMNKDEDIKTMTRFLMDTMLNTEPLKDAIHYIKDTPVIKADMPYIYAGIGLEAVNIDSIMTYYTGLNREMSINAMNLYDIYNVGTAYNTYRSGLSAAGALTEAGKIEKILTMSYDDILNEGHKRIEKMKEKMKDKDDEKIPKFLKLCI